MKTPGVTRRDMLQRGGIAVAGAGSLTLAGIGGYAWPHQAAAAVKVPTVPAAPADARGVLHFVSRPDLTPPALTIAHYGRTSSASASDPPYFILAPAGYPRTGPGVPGLMILDRGGSIVWYAPNTGFPASKGEGRTDLKVQSYQGKPVLTWWEGQVSLGHGEGKAVIADTHYRTIATINAGHGLAVDLHEFVVTPQDTALITVFRPMATDLSALGGPKQGMALSGTVQEIDIASGQVLFQWDSLDHVPVTDTYVPFAGGTKKSPFDYFHINSIAIAPDGDLLVSSRNTSTIYKVARPSGKVVWKLGGKQSSFEIGRGARFWFQHHVTALNANTLSIFDDGGAPPVKEKESRGIVVDLDTSAMKATLKRAYTHPAALAAANQGSVQVLADGRVLVGWGNLPYFSEFTAAGTLLLDGQFPIGDQSYRAFTAAWTGHPTDKPAAAARVNPAGGSTVYASWNGATELHGWTVLAGSSAGRLTQVGSQRRSGFETAITVNSEGRYFAVTANDASGNVLGQSATVRLAAS
jgi:hypothetical protein